MPRCSQHPSRRARWACPDCGTDQCPDCRQPPTAANRPPRCGDCDVRLVPLGIQDAVEPLYSRPWRFLAYPLNMASLLHLPILAVLTFTGILPLVGIVPLTMAWYMLIRHALETLKHTARGYVRPPEVKLLEVNNRLVLKTTLVLTGLPLAGYWLMANDIDHITGLAVFGIILVGFVPLMLMRLAIEESLTAALNPLGWPIPVARIGADYGLLLLYIGALFGAALFSTQFLATHIAIPWRLPAISLVQMTATLIAFHLIGYTILRHHDQLETPVATTALDELENQAYGDSD